MTNPSKMTLVSVACAMSATFTLAPAALAHPGGGMGGGMGGPPGMLESNAGGAARGLDRADIAAGDHGDKGRDTAMMNHSATKTHARSNKKGAVRGLARADVAAGANGDAGRDNAAVKQADH